MAIFPITPDAPKLPTSQQISRGTWVGSWGEPVWQTGAQGWEMGLERAEGGREGWFGLWIFTLFWRHSPLSTGPTWSFLGIIH